MVGGVAQGRFQAGVGTGLPQKVVGAGLGAQPERGCAAQGEQGLAVSGSEDTCLNRTWARRARRGCELAAEVQLCRRSGFRRTGAQRAA